MKGLKRITAMALICANACTAFASANQTTSVSNINAKGGDAKVILDNKYWYKVKLPGIIELQFDGDANSYKSDYVTQVCGEAPGKLLQINSYDFDMNSDNETIKVLNYIGQADKGKRTHYYVVGTGEGDEPQLTKEWQNVTGLMTKKADNVKTGSYTGSANFKFKLVDPGNANNLKLNNEDVMAMAGETKNIEAIYNGEDVSKVMDWTSTNENVATVVNGELKVNKMAKAGESTIITGELPEDWDEKYHSAFVDTLFKAFGPMVVQAEELSESSTSVSFEVTVVDIAVKENNKDVSSVRIKPGAKTTLTAVPTPDDGNNVKWFIPELDGLTANIDGNSLELTTSAKIKDGTTFNITVSSITCTKVIPVTITAAVPLPTTSVKATGTHLGMTYKLYDTDSNGTNETLVISGKQTAASGGSDWNDRNAPWRNGSGVRKVIFDNATLINGNCLFLNAREVQSIIFNPNVNTSQMTNMNHMFAYCYSLSEIGISYLDTSNVTSMDWLFSVCMSLENVNLSNWNVKKVKSCQYLFHNGYQGDCMRLKTVDLSGWELSSVGDYNLCAMAEYCGRLQQVKMPKSINPNCYQRNKINMRNYITMSNGKTIYDKNGNNIDYSIIANYLGQTVTIK